MVVKSCQQPSRSPVLFLICPCSYQALYSYVPQNDDELELRDGDIVDVMEKCDDGWFVGKTPVILFSQWCMEGRARDGGTCQKQSSLHREQFLSPCRNAGY